MRILHGFGFNAQHGGHGLGDHVQFTSALRHIKAQCPDWQNFVVCGPGRQSTFNGLCEETYVFGKHPPENSFDKVIWHHWPESYSVFPDWPSTKTVKCIAEQLHLNCDWDLLRYKINVSDLANEMADDYIKTLPNKKFAIIHYQGNTACDRKNIQHGPIGSICNHLLKFGITPVILDWDNRTNLVDQRTVFNPNKDNPLWGGIGTGEADRIAALMSRSVINICIDSGPGKVAQAVDTPCLTLWTQHHPLHFADNCLHNTTHIIPKNHVDFIRGDKNKGLSNLDKFYKYKIYENNRIEDAVIKTMSSMLNLDPMTTGSLTSRSFGQEYYQQHHAAGLDYLAYGDWQKKYGKWIVESLGMRGKSVLDIGCACGSIAAGMSEYGAFVSGCDLSQHMIDLGRSKWQGFPLFVCDSVNLHLWQDATFDFIHSQQVFEHFKPELVPFILKEMNRVAKPNGILFAIFDTAELFERNNRTMETEDPTHTCVKSLSWWYPLLKDAGWELAPDLWDALKKHPESYFKEYDWDGIICRKIS